MKKRVKPIEEHPLNKLFKDSFKKKLIQQIESKIITPKQVTLKFGIGRSVLSEWKSKYGKEAERKEEEKQNNYYRKINERIERSEMSQELQRLKTEVQLYKDMLELAKSEYGIDLKKNYGI
jgi:hypothetical protein